MSTIQVDAHSDVPVYQQIVDQVRLGVASGRLKPGDHLAPVRALARELAVNVSTVARAYRLLEHDGIIQTNRRAGSIISRDQDADELRALREGRLRAIVERSIVEALAEGYKPPELEAAFDLQLAAWRDRRHARPARLARAENGRLSRFAGSHDLALELLWAQARASDPGLDFAPSYVGSLDGLLALLHGEAALAGTHILDEESGEYNLPILRRLFPGQPLTVVTLAERQQGLIVRPGNPRHLAGLADLAQPGLRFVNRQPGSGTRTLLDFGLRRARISGEHILGYSSVVGTHLAVAEAVAEARADVGLGLAGAARAYGLSFVPLVMERYDLVLFSGDRQSEPLAHLLDIIGSTAYRSVVAELGGYDTTHTGEERTLG